MRFTSNLRRGVASALALSAALSSGASAQLAPQPRLGSRIPAAPEKFSAATAQKLVKDFAVCVVAKRQALASAFVLDRSTLSFGPNYEKLADGGCLSGWMSEIHPDLTLELHGDSIRFAFAEALVRPELSGITADQIQSAAALAIPEPGVTDPSESSKDREKDLASQAALTVWYKLGDCAVRANPVAAKSLLEAQQGSSAEGAAIGELMPALGSCLIKGTQITLNRVKLRGAVAFSYYSLAHAPRAPRR